MKSFYASESQIVNSCIKWLWVNGCYVWRQNTGAFKPEGTNRFIRFGLKGCADIIGLTSSGKFLAVECKFRKGKQSDHQKTFQQHIEAHNGMYFLVRGIDDLEVNKERILA